MMVTAGVVVLVIVRAKFMHEPGATVVVAGPSALTRVTLIGDDFAFDTGIGVRGKGGQGAPVGVGQPSLKITGLTVGGTSV